MHVLGKRGPDKKFKSSLLPKFMSAKFTYMVAAYSARLDVLQQ